MSEQSDLLVAMTDRHTDLILKSLGTKLANYMPQTATATRLAMLDAIEEGYRAGAKYADDRTKNAGNLLPLVRRISALQSSAHYVRFDSPLWQEIEAVLAKIGGAV